MSPMVMPCAGLEGPSVSPEQYSPARRGAPWDSLIESEDTPSENEERDKEASFPAAQRFNDWLALPSFHFM